MAGLVAFDRRGDVGSQGVVCLLEAFVDLFENEIRPCHFNEIMMLKSYLAIRTLCFWCAERDESEQEINIQVLWRRSAAECNDELFLGRILEQRCLGVRGIVREVFDHFRFICRSVAFISVCSRGEGSVAGDLIEDIG